MALAVLEDALARAHIGPIAREPSIRLALAWLQRSGIAEAWQVRQFWEALASERDRTDYEGPAQYLETTLMTGAIDRWRRSARLPCGEGLGIARQHRIRALAPDLAPRPGTPHLPCMCNRYRPGERQQIERLFGARELRPFNDGPGIVHPRDPGVVVRLVDGAAVLEQMTWGFPVYVRGRVGQRGQQLKPKPVNNARFDKLGGFWARWARDPGKRCLIPATSYAEAVGNPGAMTTTWLSLRSAPMFAWAGLWTDSDEWGPVYTGVMTDCAPELAGIHDRSPVLLARDDWNAWLSAPLAELARFDRPWPAADVQVTATQVLWKDGGREQ